MTTHVHRDGPHQITVEDDHGNIARFVTVDDPEHGHRLQIEQGSRTEPRITPDAALELAAELDQWATTQYTRPARTAGRR